jgi:hypothetical protein
MPCARPGCEMKCPLLLAGVARVQRSCLRHQSAIHNFAVGTLRKPDRCLTDRVVGGHD